ncbi:MAG TPA: hypothetical protein VJ249_05630 [Candidatus Bathyarchaeia archaeon]|nr:hypothetical protein [Candidatus Bathyarchaeia archaeon]
MKTRAVITIRLVEESETKSDREIEREIFEELSKSPPKIPWMKNVLMVTVTKE